MWKSEVNMVKAMKRIILIVKDSTHDTLDMQAKYFGVSTGRFLKELIERISEYDSSQLDELMGTYDLVGDDDD